MTARRTRKTARIVLCLLWALPALPAHGGEIAGLPPPLPPAVRPAAYLDFNNDFLGRGGSTDDYRTQQIKLSFAFLNRWQVLIDHSILTLSTESPGRIDELALSLGYTLVDRATPEQRYVLVAGSGIRSASEFHGEQIQNGFHQLIGSDIEMLPYTATDDIAVTGWLVAESERRCCRNWPGGLDYGYWLRGATYLTTGGKWDSSLGAYLTARNHWFDGWLGIRGEWREGYDDDRVRSATAAAESRPGLVIGLRAGPLVLETHQQFDGESSFGHLGFVVPAGYASSPSIEASGVVFGFGIRLPDVLMQLEGRFPLPFLPGSNSWPATGFADVRYGKPQYGDRPDLFVDTWQFTVGLDWERELPASWAPALFGRAGVGARGERLTSIKTQGETDSVTRAIAVVSAGLRWHSPCNGSSWRCSVATGFEYVLVDDPAVTLDGEPWTLLGNSTSLILGFEVGFP
jgi:hypothetical protein